MVTFVPFAQRMVNKIGIYFLSDGLFFFFFPSDITHQVLIMEMFLITLLSRVVYRRKYDELEPPECACEEDGDCKQTPKIIFNGAVSEDRLPGF